MQNDSPKASGKKQKQKQNSRQIVDYIHEIQTLGITTFFFFFFFFVVTHWCDDLAVSD